MYGVVVLKFLYGKYLEGLSFLGRDSKSLLVQFYDYLLAKLATTKISPETRKTSL